MSQHIWEYLFAAADKTPYSPKLENEKFRNLLESAAEHFVTKSSDKSNYKIVASATVVCALQSLEDFVMNRKVRTLSDGKESVGRIGKYKVIRDLKATTDYLHVYRGKKKEEIVIRNLSNSSVGGMFK